MLLLLATAGRGAGADDQPYSLYLLFAEQERGVEPFQTRVLLTPDYLRFDEGENSDGFVLFDRRKQIIYSVANETRTIIIVEPKTHNIKPPFELQLSKVELDDISDAPPIGGEKPRHYQYKSRDELCYEVLSVHGLLPEYIEAKREFNLVLANDSAGSGTGPFQKEDAR